MTELNIHLEPLQVDQEAGTYITPEGHVRPITQLQALIQKSQEIAGHFPSKEALDRADRVLSGEISHELALKEIEQKYHLVASA